MPPIKSKGPAWNHVESVDDGDKWRCIYCEKEYVPSAYRIEAHLTASAGRGIASCPKVPLEVLEEFKLKAEAANKALIA